MLQRFKKLIFVVVNKKDMNLKVAIVQFDIAWEDTPRNIAYLNKNLDSIDADTDLVILPEMFHCGFSMEPKKNAQKDGGEVLDWMKNFSQKKSVAIIGSIIVEQDQKYFNRLFFVDKQSVKYYDKRHLFSMGGEHLHYEKGVERLVVNVKGWNICPMICYDLRFPVWSRNYKCAYDVLVYVANWPSSRSVVWNTLLKARAIENQSFVIGVNRIGRDSVCQYVGESQVVNAKGEVELNSLDENIIKYKVLNKNELNAFRKAFPVLNDADDFNVNI